MPYVSVLGPEDEAGDLVERSCGDWPDLPVSMPAGVAALRPGLLDVQFHWLFRAATSAPRRSRVTWRSPSSRRPVTSGSTTCSRPAASSPRPGPVTPGVRRWAVVEEHGKLLACAADTSGSPGIGHMGSVAVHPSARGHGLGSAVVGWLTADLLRGGCDVVAVGVFVAETPAQRLYDRLGYRTEHEMVSGRLTA